MKQIFFFAFILIATSLSAQHAVQISSVETTIQFGQNKTDFYGFAAGDNVIIEYKTSKKAMLELQFSAYQSNVILQERLIKKGKKEIQIPKTGIYQLSVSNVSHVNKSVEVSYIIQRKPKDETTKNFNSNVYWKEVIDTIRTIEKGRFVVGKDTSVVEIIEQTAKINSYTNVVNGNENEIKFSLPKNTTVWSFYIGVDQAGAEKYSEAVRDLAKSASPLVKLIPEVGPLAAFALNGASFLTVAQTGEDIDYCFIDVDKAKQNKDDSNTNCFKKGTVINEFGRVANKLAGNYKLVLNNNNLVQGVSVFVKITAIVVTDRIAESREVIQVKEVKKPFLAKD